MPGEPQTEECPYCNRVIMQDNAYRCDCGEAMCHSCKDQHECIYTHDPEYGQFIKTYDGMRTHPGNWLDLDHQFI